MTKLISKDELISVEEYIHLALSVNDISLRSIVNDKYKTFLRLGKLMGREALMIKDADEKTINDFLKKHHKVVGKHNESDGRGFKIYEEGINDAADIINDKQDILEEYIFQHEEYTRIYPDSINTLRIHTIRNSNTIKTVFPPFLSIGAAGSISDHPICDKALRILLDEEGNIVAGVDRWRPYNEMDTHPDTGYKVIKGKKLPYVKEAIDLCLKAALYFPELRYIGWDIAISINGPVIVEANSISGLAPKYNSRDDIINMVKFAKEESIHSHILYRANPFAKDGLLHPDTDDIFIILLQSALHRMGIEFIEREAYGKDYDKRIDLTFNLDNHILSIKNDNYSRSYIIPVFNNNINLFNLDNQAIETARIIYNDIHKTFE